MKCHLVNWSCLSLFVPGALQVRVEEPINHHHPINLKWMCITITPSDILSSWNCCLVLSPKNINFGCRSRGRWRCGTLFESCSRSGAVCLNGEAFLGFPFGGFVLYSCFHHRLSFPGRRFSRLPLDNAFISRYDRQLPAATSWTH